MVQKSKNRNDVYVNINILHNEHNFRFIVFRPSQNCEKRSLISLCLSVPLHGKTLLPLDGFSRNLIFEYVSKMCREN